MLFVRFGWQCWEAFRSMFAPKSRSKISVVFGSFFFVITEYDAGAALVQCGCNAGAARAFTAQGPPRAAPLSRGKEDITTTWRLDPGSQAWKQGCFARDLTLGVLLRTFGALGVSCASLWGLWGALRCLLAWSCTSPVSSACRPPCHPSSP